LKLQNTKTNVLGFFADQIMHPISIIAINLWYTKTEIDIENYYNFLISLTAVAFLSKPIAVN
jgi:shikimate 5-dehydrogenase